MKATLKLTALAMTACWLFPRKPELRSADVHNSDDYPTVAAVRHMSETLAKQSGGKYTIKVFNKSALGSEKETPGPGQDRRAGDEPRQHQLAELDLPEELVPTMPFLFDSIAHMRKSLDGPIGEEILKGCESQGLVGLALLRQRRPLHVTAKKPVRSFADAKGVKIRVQQSDLWVAHAGSHGRQRHADAHRRGLHRAEDRRDRRG
jgi:TRAP-type C4-dicarboxylate transport system substrate-binding protein